MKSKVKIKKTVVESLVCLSMILSVSSCAGDGFDEETFSGGVQGAQLKSPEASEVAFAKLPGTNNVKVTWPVVMGAGGYRFSLYVVDDPTNPVVVVKDSIIDGSSVVCPYIEDTNYKAEIITLGNEKLNNTASTTPAEPTWTTLVPATIVPPGDLTAWFTNNPITTGKDVEVAYELEAGGEYTISGNLDFGINNVQLRGNKLNHAKVKFTGADGKILTSGGGLALKFIDFDCDLATTGIFLGFGDIVPGELETFEAWGITSPIITNPIMIQSCNIKNVRNKFIDINGKSYAVQNLIIRDCIVEAYQKVDFINFNKDMAFVKDMEISNSTFYSHLQSGNRFIRHSGANAQNVPGWSTGSMKFLNNTFYNISYSGQSFNGNGWKKDFNSVVSKNNIFCDSFNGQFNQRIRVQSTTVAMTFGDNCYWYNGGIPVNETTGRGEGDKTTTAYNVDPGFANPVEGDFTPSAPEIRAHASGDPRWLN